MTLFAPRRCAASPRSTPRRTRNLTPPAVAWDADTPQPIREREEQVLAGDLSQLGDAVAEL